MKECNKCKQILALDMFNQRQAKCKACEKEYQRQHTLQNKEHIKQRYKKYCNENKESIKQQTKQYQQDNQHWLKDYYKKRRENNPEYYTQWREEYYSREILSYHIVYLLPDHNYVGVTNQPKFRMQQHRYYLNRNTDNWIELARFDNRADALKCEAEYHSQGYEGAKQLSTQTSCGA